MTLPMSVLTARKPRLRRAAFQEVRWQAAQQGFVLSRARRLVGAVYTLTSLDGDTVLLYDLGEVRAFLNYPS